MLYLMFESQIVPLGHYGLACIWSNAWNSWQEIYAMQIFFTSWFLAYLVLQVMTLFLVQTHSLTPPLPYLLPLITTSMWWYSIIPNWIMTGCFSHVKNVSITQRRLSYSNTYLQYWKGSKRWRGLSITLFVRGAVGESISIRPPDVGG